MNQTVRVGIIGDFNPDNRTHIATNEAINHAADALRISVDVCWVPTIPLEEQPVATLELYDALWCSPGSPYQSMDGALKAIRFAREQDYPFIGT